MFGGLISASPFRVRAGGALRLWAEHGGVSSVTDVSDAEGGPPCVPFMPFANRLDREVVGAPYPEHSNLPAERDSD